MTDELKQGLLHVYTKQPWSNLKEGYFVPNFMYLNFKQTLRLKLLPRIKFGLIFDV